VRETDVTGLGPAQADGGAPETPVTGLRGTAPGQRSGAPAKLRGEDDSVPWPLVRRSLLDDAAARVASLRAERDELLMAMLQPAPEEPPLTPGEAADLHRLFRANICSHCGGSHARACPRVRRLRFHPDAKLAAVEFWPDGQWKDDGIMWPEDLPPEPGTETAQEAA
jgi:hypothetical protein